MKSSENYINPRSRHTVGIERPISEYSAYQEAEFTDKLICSETQTNLTPSKGNKKMLNFVPKQKLSQIEQSFTSIDFFNKIEQEKKQALKNQWIKMKKEHIKIGENSDQYNKKASNNTNFSNKKIQIKGKFNDFELQYNEATQEIGPKHFQSKNQQKRKRSKTEMFIHDDELENIGASELSHNIQQDYYGINNKKQLHNHLRQKIVIDGKNKTVSVKMGNHGFVKSEPKGKSYVKQVREANHIKFVPQQEPVPRRKVSVQSQEGQNKDEQRYNHCLSRSRNPVSKSVMVQKIINLRKTFNEKYKKNPNKSSIQNCMIQSSFNQFKQVPPQSQSDANTNFMIPYMSFPVMNLKVTRKLTFQELFQNEKKKMELLKKYVTNGGVFNSFANEQKKHKSQSNQLFHQTSSNLMNLSQLSNSKSLFLAEYSNDQSYLNYLNNSKNLKKTKAKWSDLEKEEIRTIKSISKNIPQSQLQIDQIPILDLNKSLQNDLIQPCNQLNQTPQQHVMTYEFDQMNKNPQKPQIKQIRHKYLYSSKRKLQKDQFGQFGISIISVHNRDETNLRKWKIKCKTESMMEECLEIGKKVPQNWDKMGKTSANFIKTNFQRKKAASLSKQIHFKRKELNRNAHDFEPWQDQYQQHFEDQYVDDFPD